MYGRQLRHEALRLTVPSARTACAAAAASRGSAGLVFLSRSGAEAETNIQPIAASVIVTMVGRLPSTTETREGSAFDLQVFHDRVLAEGSIPVRFCLSKWR